jgi:uncharacterized membrane protein YhdT
MNKSSQITWSSGLSALAVISWLIGSWLQVAHRDAFIFPYWQWWAHGAFLALVAVVVKLGEVMRKK